MLSEIVDGGDIKEKAADALRGVTSDRGVAFGSSGVVIQVTRLADKEEVDVPGMLGDPDPGAGF